MNQENNSLKTTLSFLTKTKNGDYAPIEKTSLNYVRVNEETETNSQEDCFFYSLR